MPFQEKHKLLDGDVHYDTQEYTILEYGAIVIGLSDSLWGTLPPPGISLYPNALYYEEKSKSVIWQPYLIRWGTEQYKLYDARSIFVGSIVYDNQLGKIHLENDQDEPGPLKYYGTSVDGEKGWWDIKIETGLEPKNHNLSSNQWHIDVNGSFPPQTGRVITSFGSLWTYVQGDYDSVGCPSYLGFSTSNNQVEFLELRGEKHIEKNNTCQFQLVGDPYQVKGYTNIFGFYCNALMYYGTLKGKDDGWHSLPMYLCDDGSVENWCNTSVDSGQPSVYNNLNNPKNPVYVDNQGVEDHCLNPNDNIYNLCDTIKGWGFGELGADPGCDMVLDCPYVDYKGHILETTLESIRRKYDRLVLFADRIGFDLIPAETMDVPFGRVRYQISGRLNSLASLLVKANLIYEEVVVQPSPSGYLVAPGQFYDYARPIVFSQTMYEPFVVIHHVKYNKASVENVQIKYFGISKY